MNVVCGDALTRSMYHVYISVGVYDNVHIGEQDAVIIFEERGRNEVRGTYIHPRLITPLAMWLSDALGYKVSCIIEAHAIQENAKKAESDRRAQMTVIGRLMEDVAKSNKETEIVTETNAVLRLELATLMKEKEAGVLDLSKALRKLDLATDERVPPTGVEAHTERTLYLKNNYEGDDLDKDWGFSVLRRQVSTIKYALRDHKKTYPAAEEFYSIEDTPNAVNDHNRVKAILQGQGALFSKSGTMFDLPANMSDEMFKILILGVEADRKNI